MNDQALSFFFKNIPVRGHICRLNNSITNALANHQNYPDFAKRLLGEMAAITQCFVMDIKDGDFHGTLQITGFGPIKMALVDAHLPGKYRVCATFNNSEAFPNAISLPSAFGDNAQMVLTIDILENRYQTIVALNGENLEATLQHYFIQSQQIPTIVVCKSSTNDSITNSGALILQKMPEQQSADSEELWHELALLTSTLKEVELLNPELALNDILYRLYNQHDVIVSRETFPAFACSCSAEKIANVLSMLKEDDQQEPCKTINCEFCGKIYQMDN